MAGPCSAVGEERLKSLDGGMHTSRACCESRLRACGFAACALQGKNVNVLMPPPFSTHHNQYLTRFKKTGGGLRAVAFACFAMVWLEGMQVAI